MESFSASMWFVILIRWIHYVAGVTWIGHLWFFNYVNAHVAKTFDPETKKKVVPELMPRALYWFRWGAMFTFLSGWILFIYTMVAEDTATYWKGWIGIGALFGTIMWYNVWFVIWVNQKKIIGFIKDGGEKPENLDAMIAQAGFRSRVNTYLSVPLLFTMGAARHFPTFGIISVPVGLALGFGTAYFFLNVLAPSAAPTKITGM